MFRVCTANVNGVRAAERRGGIDWLAQQSHDAVLMQEVRASDAQLDEALAGTDLGAAGVVHAPAEQAGRSGVAIVSRLPLTDPRVGLGAEEFSGSGRWIEATAPTPIGDVRLVSVYVHSGEAGTEKQEEKYRFLTAMTHRLGQLSATFEQVLVGGDINIAHTERDIRNAKGNRGRAGFLTEERAYLSGWLACGWSTSPDPTTAMWTGPTPGGPGEGRRSTATPAGASTAPTRRLRSQPGSPRPTSVGPQPTPSVGATTHR